MRDLLSLNVWSQIKPLADQSRTKKAAIAYVTADEIVQFGASDLLVCDASDTAIGCGETSARVLQNAFDRGARLYSCEGLHAKVVVFDTVAMIGSANLSKRSERDLVEASWVTDDPTLVAKARSFVECLASHSRLIEAAELQRLLSIKVARGPPLISKRDAKLKLDSSRSDVERPLPSPARPPSNAKPEVATTGKPKFLALQQRQARVILTIGKQKLSVDHKVAAILDYVQRDRSGNGLDKIQLMTLLRDDYGYTFGNKPLSRDSRGDVNKCCQRLKSYGFVKWEKVKGGGNTRYWKCTPEGLKVKLPTLD